ncbi:hypothetical protein ACLB2K_069951 [Fragaria x ananassa]
MELLAAKGIKASSLLGTSTFKAAAISQQSQFHTKSRLRHLCLFWPTSAKTLRSHWACQCFGPRPQQGGDEGTNVKMVCAGRATSRMRKENGARPDFLTRRMRAPASSDEEIFPSLLFLITCRSILTVRASRATIGKSETSPDGLRDLKRDALRTLGFREDSKVLTVYVCLREIC